MDRAGLLAKLFPEIEACRRTAVRYYGRGGVLEHSFETLENLEWILRQAQKAGVRDYLASPIGGYPRSAWLKWAAFLHDSGKPATAKLLKGRLRFFEHEHVGAELAMRSGKRLRCSRQEVQLLGLWVRNHMRAGSLAAAAQVTSKALARYFRDLGEEGIGMVLVSLADHYTYLAKSSWGKGKDPVEKMARRLVSSYYEERSKILPARLVNGHDLMRHLRLKPGPEIGKLLEALQDAQVEGKVTTKKEALAFAKKRLLRQ
jgi:poly(A) polymerase